MNYEKPYNESEIRKYYPKLANMLLKDPAHKWRAETGIELIHREPDLKEQIRIWNNWQLMTETMKEESDKKSIELFGLTNEQHHNKIMDTLKK